MAFIVPMSIVFPENDFIEMNLDEEYAWPLTHNISMRIEFEDVGI
jgi:hypothetical protein